MLLPSDIRIDTFRVGKHSNWVNTPDRGVRVTHISTGIKVECTEHRSVYKNRYHALVELDKILSVLSNFYTPTAVIQ
ncbi:RF-1 domain peptide chain release factor [Acinetobacter phage ZZ1]|jgi:protein subunit release factor A|uniref:Prokaryotic-type class I peptide chain release factors domain-containing protein n=3 Tax=Caudoviricetes TaxID=2731619 RepID=A0A410T5J5_9CAUD|nr:RF-1 domain peptide chain release factor [Acinetobacter phage ZZ1]AEJ90202.1 hypothetical protein ZZ1p0148 [Acinetobacter phage ZZ1]QAU04000.1 hypothetical protein Henu6_gp197 [Acinetobacter phage Henu6]